METLINKTEKNDLKRVLRFFTLLFSFLVLFTINVSANETGTKSSLPSVKEETGATLADAQKDASRQNYLNYVLMGIGLVIIFGISWFTRSGKKKTGDSGISEKNPMVKYRHSSHDKRYGTNRSRG